MSRTFYAVMLATALAVAGGASYVVLDPSPPGTVDAAYGSGDASMSSSDEPIPGVPNPVPEEIPEEAPEPEEIPVEDPPVEEPPVPEEDPVPEQPVPEDLPNPQDIIIEDEGEGDRLDVEWVWEVTEDFEEFTADLVVEIDRQAGALIDCVEAYLYDADGNVVAREATPGGLLAGNDQWHVQFAVEDGELDNYAPGEWRMTLHGAGAYVEYDLDIKVLH